MFYLWSENKFTFENHFFSQKTENENIIITSYHNTFFLPEKKGYLHSLHLCHVIFLGEKIIHFFTLVLNLFVISFFIIFLFCFETNKQTVKWNERKRIRLEILLFFFDANENIWKKWILHFHWKNVNFFCSKLSDDKNKNKKMIEKWKKNSYKYIFCFFLGKILH